MTPKPQGPECQSCREKDSEIARLRTELDLARLTVERLTLERDAAQPAEDWARQRGLKLGRRKK